MDIERLKELEKAKQVLILNRSAVEYDLLPSKEDQDFIEAVDVALALIDAELAGQSMPVGETSDGYHTFNELYEHRTALFATLCNIRSDRSWKAMKHDDGTMYDGMFIAGIETPYGQYTYHCDLEYLYMFAHTPERDKAPPYDGHQPKDYPRLLKLSGDSLYRNLARQPDEATPTSAKKIDLIIADEQERFGKQLKDLVCEHNSQPTDEDVQCEIERLKELKEQVALKKYDFYGRRDIRKLIDAEIARQSVTENSDSDIDGDAYHEWENTLDHGQE